jgi:very-short-patch-repair endonuclease
MRLSAIKRREKQYGHCYPNHNPKSISRLKEEAKKYNITDLQHAETPGGEFQVCGYFVDGFSPSKNIVIEYYEKAHKYKKERDKRRKREIIKELGCKFIEIGE